MPRFTYVGGQDFDESELPALVHMFGVRFILERPTDVTPEMFRQRKDYDHAVAKLSVHKHFKEVKDEEGFAEVIEEPKKKRGRPAKVPTAPVEEAVVLNDHDEH